MAGRDEHKQRREKRRFARESRIFSRTTLWRHNRSAKNSHDEQTGQTFNDTNNDTYQDIEEEEISMEPENIENVSILENDNFYGNFMDIDIDVEPIPKNNLDVLIETLREILQQRKLPFKTANQLLMALRKFGLQIPTDIRSIMRRKKLTVKPRKIIGGENVHLGIKEGLRHLAKLYSIIKESSEIQIDVSYDGVSLSKSSNKSLWLISGAIVNENYPPFLISAFYGTSKPKKPRQFFREMLKEAHELRKNGFRLQEDTENITKVKIRAFVADAPARQMATETCGHNGSKGCPYCEQMGVMYNMGHMRYKKQIFCLRTNKSFRERSDPGHHHEEKSAFEKYPYYDMVLQFPPDCMHLIDLGVSKKLINQIFSSLRPGDRRTIGLRLKALKPFVSSDIKRKPRSFDELKHFKATEFRNLLLYYAPIIFKDLRSLHVDQYTNLCEIHIAYRLLLTGNAERKVSPVNIVTARTLIKRFVKNYCKLYGEDSMVYNFHVLLHLVDFVQLYGTVDGFSAYKYENSYQLVGKYVKKPQDVLVQIQNGQADSRQVDKAKSSKFNQFTITTNTTDNCVLLRDKKSVFLIEKISIGANQEKIYTGRKYRAKKRFYQYPIKSENAFVWVICENNMTKTFDITGEDIILKFMKLPYPVPLVNVDVSSQKFVVIPILHYMKE